MKRMIIQASTEVEVNGFIIKKRPKGYVILLYTDWDVILEYTNHGEFCLNNDTWYFDTLEEAVEEASNLEYEDYEDEVRPYYWDADEGEDY